MLNKVLLIGFVGQDPEIKTIQSTGKEFAVFSLATSEKWKDKESEERKEKTEWHRVVVFNEYIVPIIKQYVKKGSKLYIDGQLSVRKWTDDNDIERYASEIVIKGSKHQVVLLDKRESSGNRPPDDSYEEQ